MKTLVSSLILCFAIYLGTSFAQVPPNPPPPGPSECLPITTALEGTNFTQILGLLQSSPGLLQNFSGPFTLIAPTDAAFLAMSQGNATNVSLSLESWFIGGNVSENFVSELTSLSVNALDGSFLQINNIRGIIGVGGVQVTQIIEACNISIFVVEEFPKHGVVDFVNNILSNPRLLVFNEALQLTGLDEELFIMTVGTIFAPVDEAFDSLAPEALANITTDDRALRKLISNHIVNQTLFSFQLQGSFPSIGGLMLNFSGPAGNATLPEPQPSVPLTVNNATIVQADDVKTNGVLHLIDSLLL
jgi:uncharacterized surface protein with fasciclin (FAS1) repeats